MGNRTQKTDSATGTETYSTDAANRLLSVSSGNPNNGAYTSDANGNTLTGGGRVNTWDSQNRLVKVVKAGVTSEFTYGSDGLRRRSIVTNAAGEATQTDYVYDGTMMVAETVRHYTGGSQVGQTENVSYLQGPSGPLYRKSSLQADPKWYVYDGLGSVVGEVDVLGNLSATKAHDVYGLTRNVTGNPTSRQGFVGGLGHVSDDETGLIYMRARHYDPSVGRFESEDPEKSGLNWFAYCSNDPINLTDCQGTIELSIWDSIAMAYASNGFPPPLSLVKLLMMSNTSAVEWISKQLGNNVSKVFQEEEQALADRAVAETKLKANDGGYELAAGKAGVSAKNAARRAALVTELQAINAYLSTQSDGDM